MPTQITEIVDSERGKTILRVEGGLLFDDAVLLEKIALGMRAENGANLTLDFADLDFLDSESAPIIKRLGGVHGFEIKGIEIFLQTVINQTEKRKS